MNFGLTEEQEMIVSTVRSFVENEIYPHEDLVERSGEVPVEIANEIKRKTLELGFYACNFPEEVGGAGLSHLDFALVERELGRGSMALNHFFWATAEHPDGLRGRTARPLSATCGARRKDGCFGHDRTRSRLGCTWDEMYGGTIRWRLAGQWHQTLYLRRRSC
jgi:hypothetical protein